MFTSAGFSSLICVSRQAREAKGGVYLTRAHVVSTSFCQRAFVLGRVGGDDRFKKKKKEVNFDLGLGSGFPLAS